jgi:hypothetical protein
VSEHWREVPRLITQLYEVTDELEERFGRKFTPDGHLMGSLRRGRLANFRIAPTPVTPQPHWASRPADAAAPFFVSGTSGVADHGQLPTLTRRCFGQLRFWRRFVVASDDAVAVRVDPQSACRRQRGFDAPSLILDPVR